MNDSLYVWMYLGSVPVLCGRLDLIQGRRCAFSYDESWLERKNAFEISPDIPLLPGPIMPPSNLDLHPAFDDASPDKWGRQVINKAFNPARRSPLEYLMLSGSNRIGAMAFSESKDQIINQPDSFGVHDLHALQHASALLSGHYEINSQMVNLLKPGTSAGGARPKSIIRYANEEWIAKFSAYGDDHDVCAIEHASLALARISGINAADSRLVSVNQKNALLVRRFDRVFDGVNENRLHIVSARTMLIAFGAQEGSMGYGDIADIIRRLSSNPKRDCHELFRRMVFNVLVENTDDHERNHSFIRHNGGWSLSPAYDVLPQLQGVGYQQLAIGKSGSESSVENAISEPERFMLNRADAETILSDVMEKISCWKEVFMVSGVTEEDISRCERYIAQPPRQQKFARPKP